MGRLMRSYDWSNSALGAPDSWPQALRTAVRIMLNTGHPVYIFWGPQSICLYNDAYSQSIGPERHPVSLGQPGHPVWEEIWHIIGPQIAQVLAGGAASWHVNQLVPTIRNGVMEDVYWTYSYSPIDDDTAASGVGGVLVLCTETTEQVLSIRRAQEERESFAELFQQAPTFMTVLRGPEHRFELANPNYLELVGGRDIIGRTVAEALPEAVNQGFLQLLDQVYQSGEPYTAVSAKFAPNEREAPRYLDFVYQPIKDASGAVNGIFVEGVDVSKRKRDEERRDALVRLTDEIRDLEDPDEIAFVAARILGETLNVSRAGYGTVDVERETITIARDWNAPGIKSLAGVLEFRDYGSYIEDLKRGETVIFSDARTDPRTAANAAALENISARAVVNHPVSEQGGLVALLYLNHADMRAWPDEDLTLIREIAERTRTASERLRAASALKESEARLRLLNADLAQARDRIWRLSTDVMLVAQSSWYINAANPAWELALGWKEADLLGRHFIELVHPDDVARTTAEIARLAAGATSFRFENRYRRKDGSYSVIDWTAVPEEGLTYAVGRDVTAEREAAASLEMSEEALRQAQKMEAVGQLTGGLAHDFNNMLAGISGSLQVMQMKLAQGRSDDLERFIGVAMSGTRRAAALTQRLLAFSRRQTLDPKPTDVNRLVAGMEDLIRRTIGPSIELEVVQAAGLWATLVDPPQLENALLNLCINARDAMPDGGRLTIETANKWLDERAGRERELPAGQYISLCVTDTGTGMTPEVVERAFEPFFTTKPLGEGTGLGLSMIYGFARQSGGQVRIYSELGQGTTMCVYLPRNHREPGVADESEARDVPTEVVNGKVVMVVDDEPAIRMLAGEVLGQDGYAIVEAGDGAEAMRILQSPARIDLLITDVGLPGGMNGRQVADAARVARPGLQVLFITGYAENAVVGNGHLEHGMQILTKPFPIEMLQRRVRDMIG